MEINLSSFLRDCGELSQFSGSVAELGDNAGKLTWDNCCEFVTDRPLLTVENVNAWRVDRSGEKPVAVKMTLDEIHQTARDYLADFGAWSRSEIASWSIDELNAIIWQDACNSLREREPFLADEDELAEYEESCGGRLFEDEDGDTWFYCGL